MRLILVLLLAASVAYAAPHRNPDPRHRPHRHAPMVRGHGDNQPIRQVRRRIIEYSFIGKMHGIRFRAQAMLNLHTMTVHAVFKEDRRAHVCANDLSKLCRTNAQCPGSKCVRNLQSGFVRQTVEGIILVDGNRVTFVSNFARAELRFRKNARWDLVFLSATPPDLVVDHVIKTRDDG